MLSRILRGGIAALAFLCGPTAAEAALYEAVWNVQLTTQLENGSPVAISRPSSFQYKVYFSDQIGEIRDGPGIETSVYLDPAAVKHFRPDGSYLPARPAGSSVITEEFFTSTTDDLASFLYNIGTIRTETVNAGDVHWQLTTSLLTGHTEDSRGGTGDNDYPILPPEMLAYLEQGMTNPESVTSGFLERLEIRAGENGALLQSLWWWGDMQLVSLRVLSTTEVPEPPLMALVGVSLLGLRLSGRRQRQRAA